MEWPDGRRYDGEWVADQMVDPNLITVLAGAFEHREGEDQDTEEKQKDSGDNGEL